MVSDHCVLSALSKVQISFVFQLDVPLFLPLRFPYQMIKGPAYCKSLYGLSDLSYSQNCLSQWLHGYGVSFV